MSTDERIARQRVDQACQLIRSAYRLHSLDPVETILQVKGSIKWGAQLQAQDIEEAADRVA